MTARGLRDVVPITTPAHRFMCRCSDVEHVSEPACYRPGRAPDVAEAGPPESGLFPVPWSPHTTYRTLLRQSLTLADYAHWRAVLANLPAELGPDDLDPSELGEYYPAEAIAYTLERLADAGLGWVKSDHAVIADCLDVKADDLPTMDDPPESDVIDHDAAVEYVLTRIADVALPGPVRKALATALVNPESAAEVSPDRVGTARTRKNAAPTTTEESTT